MTAESSGYRLYDGEQSDKRFLDKFLLPGKQNLNNLLIIISLSIVVFFLTTGQEKAAELDASAYASAPAAFVVLFKGFLSSNAIFSFSVTYSTCAARIAAIINGILKCKNVGTHVSQM